MLRMRLSNYLRNAIFSCDIFRFIQQQLLSYKFVNKRLINFAQFYLGVKFIFRKVIRYASAKKIWESVIDESNFIATQQHEGRRRRYVNESALLNESTGLRKTDHLAGTRRVSFFWRNRKNSEIMQIQRLSVRDPAALVDLPRSL